MKESKTKKSSKFPFGMLGIFSSDGKIEMSNEKTVKRRTKTV